MRSHHDALVWKSVIRPEILSVLLVVPEQMSGLNLMAYIDHLKTTARKPRAMKSRCGARFFTRWPVCRWR